MSDDENPETPKINVVTHQTKISSDEEIPQASTSNDPRLHVNNKPQIFITNKMHKSESITKSTMPRISSKANSKTEVAIAGCSNATTYKQQFAIADNIHENIKKVTTANGTSKISSKKIIIPDLSFGTIFRNMSNSKASQKTHILQASTGNTSSPKINTKTVPRLSSSHNPKCSTTENWHERRIVSSLKGSNELPMKEVNTKRASISNVSNKIRNNVQNESASSDINNKIETEIKNVSYEAAAREQANAMHFSQEKLNVIHAYTPDYSTINHIGTKDRDISAIKDRKHETSTNNSLTTDNQNESVAMNHAGCSNKESVIVDDLSGISRKKESTVIDNSLGVEVRNQLLADKTTIKRENETRDSISLTNHQIETIADDETRNEVLVASTSTISLKSTTALNFIHQPPEVRGQTYRSSSSIDLNEDHAEVQSNRNMPTSTRYLTGHPPTYSAVMKMGPAPPDFEKDLRKRLGLEGDSSLVFPPRMPPPSYSEVQGIWNEEPRIESRRYPIWTRTALHGVSKLLCDRHYGNIFRTFNSNALHCSCTFHFWLLALLFVTILSGFLQKYIPSLSRLSSLLWNV